MAKKAAAISPLVLAAIKASKDKQGDPKKSLEKLRKAVADTAALQKEINDLMVQVEAKQTTLSRIRNEDLPALFEGLETTSLTLAPSGNMPGFVAELKAFYSANLPDDERRAKAFKKFPWLKDLTKNRFTIDFDKGDGKRAKALESTLKKSKVEYDNKVSVHASTLTSEIRRRFEDGKPLAPADMNLLGAYAGTVVKLTEVKA
jgi:hypothetical protein